MMLRYVFLVVLVLLAIVSIGSAFIWDDAGTTDYIIAISAALLANQMPGSTRTLAPTSMRPSPHTYEHIGLACASVSILATLIGSVTATDTTASSITIPWIIATLALLATICISRSQSWSRRADSTEICLLPRRASTAEERSRQRWKRLTKLRRMMREGSVSTVATWARMASAFSAG